MYASASHSWAVPQFHYICLSHDCGKNLSFGAALFKQLLASQLLEFNWAYCFLCVQAAGLRHGLETSQKVIQSFIMSSSSDHKHDSGRWERLNPDRDFLCRRTLSGVSAPQSGRSHSAVPIHATRSTLHAISSLVAPNKKSSFQSFILPLFLPYFSNLDKAPI